MICRILLLLSLSAGAVCALQVCVEKQPTPRGPGGSCQLELLSSQPDVQWYQGTERISAENQWQRLQFGGSMLSLTLNDHPTGTVYRCQHQATGEEISVDVGPTCSHTHGVTVLPDGSCQRYQTVKAVLTGLFLAICLTALMTTYHLCREQTSSTPRNQRLDAGEDAIYSDLKDVTSEGHQAKTETSGPQVPAGPSGSSDVTVVAEVGLSESLREQAESRPRQSLREQAESRPGQSLREQAESRPRQSLREQAESRPRQSLREQAGSGPSSTHAEPKQEAMYSSLKERPQDAEYQVLKPQGQDGEGAVTYSADAEEVIIQTP